MLLAQRSTKLSAKLATKHELRNATTLSGTLLQPSEARHMRGPSDCTAIRSRRLADHAMVVRPGSRLRIAGLLSRRWRAWLRYGGVADQPSSDLSINSAPCPSFPGVRAMPARAKIGLLETSQTTGAQIARRQPAKAQAIPGHRTVFSCSHQKRGPPPLPSC